MDTKTLREQVRLLFDIIQDDNMDVQEALDFLDNRESLTRWGITDQNAVEIVYGSIADDGEDDFYHQRACADMEANR